MWVQVLWALVMLDQVVKFDTATTLEAISGETTSFLEEPLSFDVDSQGNYYLLDGGAKTVFVWDASGAFKRTLGKAGPGPGEFVLEGGGGANGHLNVVGETLYVLDSRKREIMTFSLDGSFRKAIPLRMARGRILQFAVLGPQAFLVHRRATQEEKGVSEVVVLDGEGNTTKTLYAQPDDSFQRTGSGDSGTFKVKAFYPSLVSFYHRGTGELILGKNTDPSIELVGKDQTKRVFKLAMMRTEVTKADKEDYMKRFENARRVPQVTFPNQKAFYTHVLAAGTGYLVYRQSEYGRVLEGLHLDAKGATRGRFQMACGPAGGLLGARGRILAVTLNEDEEFHVGELTLK